MLVAARIRRVELEQRLADRARLESGGGDARACLRDLHVGRHVDVVRRDDVEPLPLVIAEEEGAEVLDWKLHTEGLVVKEC